jgi:hypothetical protein
MKMILRTGRQDFWKELVNIVSSLLSTVLRTL